MDTSALSSPMSARSRSLSCQTISIRPSVNYQHRPGVAQSSIRQVATKDFGERGKSTRYDGREG